MVKRRNPRARGPYPGRSAARRFDRVQAVYQQTVVLKLMPMNNATQITDAEREVIRRWYAAGAPVLDMLDKLRLDHC